MEKKSFRVAIVGASGAVGQELLDVLTRRRFAVASLRLLGSERSAGKTATFQGEKLPVELFERRMMNNYSRSEPLR